MNRLTVCFAALALVVCGGSQARSQLPATCHPPADAANAPAGTSRSKVYDAIGVWFAQKGDLDCSVAAFKYALQLDPRSAEAHFDLGLVRQSQGDSDAAAREFQLTLRYQPGLLQARCALGSVLSDPASAESEFRKALAVNPQLVCALDGLAQVLLQEKHYDAAVDYWRKAVRLQPDAPDLQLSLATAIYKAADARQNSGLPAAKGSTVADSIHLFTELLSKHPDLTAAHFTLGNIYASQKLFQKAADEYRVVASQDPSNTIALAAEVKSLIDAGAYSAALEPARDYVDRKPDDPSGHIMLGTVYREQGDFAKAEPELELGVTGAPDDFEARYQLGLVLVRLGKPEKALPQLRKAVALRPGDKSAQFQLVAALRALGQRQEAQQIASQLQSETGEEFLKSKLAPEGIKANNLLQSGKPAEAAQIYRHMLQEDPNSARTAYNLALALEAMHDTKGAEDTLRNALAIDPTLASVPAELGQLELAAGNLQSAQKWLESALSLDPGLVKARMNLAMVYARNGDLITAEKLLRQAVEDDPKYKEGYLRLGVILAQQGRKSDAEAELDKAIALAPQDPATLSAAGKAKVQMGNLSGGIPILREVVKLVPNLAAAHLDLALALSESYDLPAALAQTTEAVHLAPQSAFAHFYRGRILYDLSHTVEAVPEFESACALDPKMPEPRYFLALIDKHEGKLQSAASLLEETVKLQPQNVMAWYLLGQTLQQESETAKAIAAWRSAIAVDPKFSQALFSLARALRSTDRAESDQLMDRYLAVQKERLILDRADTLANNGIQAASAHDWPEATRQLKAAIVACGDCAAKADLHRKLGIINCQAGNLDDGEKELLAARALKPNDPVTQAALELVARARSQHAASASGRQN